MYKANTKRRRNVLFHGFAGARPGPASRGFTRARHPSYVASAVRARLGARGRTGGFTGIERKFFDVETDADVFTTSWATMEPATTNLSAIGQGDGESNRDGRKYVIDSINLKGFLELPGGEATTDPPDSVSVRVCLVLDTQTNGAQLTATDVMDAGQTKDFLAFRRLDNVQRFKVLWDRTFTLQINTLSHIAANLFSNSVQVVSFKKSITFNPPLQVNMSGTTADIANVRDNSLHMIGVSSAFNAAIVPRLSYQCRIRFRG